MVRISIEKFAKMYVKTNKGQNLMDVISQLRYTVKRKQEGATCNMCGAPIWAIGSAIGGFDGCFTCITGEHDDSEDYEVY
ncbi:MAG: hypothetical protein AAGU75_22110 [Bacillota bacterium]